MGHSKGGGNCVFCKIATGEIPSERLYEDDHFFCIRDLQPQAKAHLLLISKEHAASLDEVYPAGGPAKAMGAKVLESATQAARKAGLLPGGFRLVINTGPNGGQTVFHLHIHLLGGEDLRATFG